MRIPLFLATLLLVWAAAESNFPYLGTDASKAAIPLDQILSAGPPPQGIPALGFSGDRNNQFPVTAAPKFVAVTEARELSPEEPLIVYGDRAYPLQILLWHEIVNDSAGAPVAITYSPATNSAGVFDRRIAVSDTEREAILKLNPKAKIAALDAAYRERYKVQTGKDAPAWGLEVSFGTSGMLYNANTLMFDSATSTVFSQLLGQGAVGLLTNSKLLRYPTQIVSFGEFAKDYPKGQVLSRDTGFKKAYGQNPYFGYDRSQITLQTPAPDSRLASKERVVSLELGTEAVAYPFASLTGKRVVNDKVGNSDIVVWWAPGTRSALDAAVIDKAKDIGAVGVFRRSLEGRTLSFQWDGSALIDQETKSHWNLLGQATQGPLQGKQLEAVTHDTAFWFAWAAFKPNTQIRP